MTRVCNGHGLIEILQHPLLRSFVCVPTARAHRWAPRRVMAGAEAWARGGDAVRRKLTKVCNTHQLVEILKQPILHLSCSMGEGGFIGSTVSGRTYRPPSTPPPPPAISVRPCSASARNCKSPEHCKLQQYRGATALREHCKSTATASHYGPPRRSFLGVQ